MNSVLLLVSEPRVWILLMYQECVFKDFLRVYCMYISLGLGVDDHACNYEPLCYWWLISPILNNAINLKNHWNPGKWVLIWEHSVRPIQWVPTWQGLDDFQKCLRFCALDESNLGIERVIIINCLVWVSRNKQWVWLIPILMVVI